MENTTITETNTLLSRVHNSITLRKKELSAIQALNQPVSKENPLVISFVGKFKTGKSSLINALIGQEILPTRSTTATSVITHIINRPRPSIWLCEGGTKTRITLEQAQDIILNYKTKNVENCVEVIFEIPIPWLSDNVEIRDTPGMDDSAQNGILEEVTMRALKDTDLCVCVYDASQMLSGKERERTQKIRKMLGENTVFAVNRINLVNSPENLELVKNLAANFFQRKPSTPSDMGKYFIISSAPGNLYLDGFDSWFKKIASNSVSSVNQRIRNSSIASRIRLLAEDLITSNSSDFNKLTQQQNRLQNAHRKSISDKEKTLKLSAKAKETYFTTDIIPQATEYLCNTNSLKEKLDRVVLKEKSEGKYTSSEYSLSSAKVVCEHFKSRYAEICKKWPEYFQKNDNKFIGDTLGCVSFPGRHAVSVPSSNKSKVETAGAGALFGLILGGPVGALIGAAFGGAVGLADDMVDDSVSNTMEFVKNSVLNTLRLAFNAKLTEISKQIKNNIGSLSSGYESALQKLDNEKLYLSQEKNNLTNILNTVNF